MRRYHNRFLKLVECRTPKTLSLLLMAAVITTLQSCLGQIRLEQWYTTSSTTPINHPNDDESLGLPSSSNGIGFCQEIRNAKDLNISEKAGNDIYLILSKPEMGNKCNIFHVLWSYVAVVRDAIIHGVIDYARRYDNQWTLHVALPECHQWLERMIQGFPIYGLSLSIVTERTDDFDSYMIREKTTQENCFILKHKWGSFLGGHDFWESNTPGSTAEQMNEWSESMMRQQQQQQQQVSSGADDITTTIRQDICERQRPTALFVERSCTGAPRTAIDLETGQPAFPIILPKVRQLGYDTELLHVCNNNTDQQFAKFSQANVVISVHGAQLSNMIFMRPCTTTATTNFRSAVIEISFRFAWCDPKPSDATNGSRAAMLERWYQCPARHRHYHKADFFRLATGMGLRYSEIMQHSLADIVPNSTNPIAVGGVVVNSSHLLQELKRLKEEVEEPPPPPSGEDGHPWIVQQEFLNYNGQEGVQPYRIGRLGLLETFGQRLKQWHREWFK